jgi:hypothetical protein
VVAARGTNSFPRSINRSVVIGAFYIRKDPAHRAEGTVDRVTSRKYKEIVPLDSVAGNTLIGMFTRLIFRKPFQVARAAMIEH